MEDDNLCPTCGEKAESTCRCLRRDSTCKNGHQRHTCVVCEVKVKGLSDHSLATFTCTCGSHKKTPLR